MVQSPALAATSPGAAATLEKAFRDALVRSGGTSFDPVPRLAFLAPEAIIIEHDVPFPMSVEDYADHLRFHAQHWERHDWIAYDLAVVLHGQSGIVTCNYAERGKPKNAGFRLRAGSCMAVCSWDRGAWRALGLSMSPLTAQILDASPG
jgi:hypothetical protein